ncbi:MAG: 3-hydroxyacyl-CoA dehydrogenase family protein [Pseudomonadota bacterium]
MSTKAPIGIIGAGLMGHGIAQVFAKAGHRVKVYDSSAKSLETLHARVRANFLDLGESIEPAGLISAHADLAEAVLDVGLVIEAAAELLEIKKAIFADLERLAPPAAILASNSSVIPISRISDGLRTQDRIVATHWWNPPFLVPLVEVVGAPATTEMTISKVMGLLASVGKTPAYIKKDVPGFVGNRLQHALWREAIAMVADGICDAETVDTVVKASFGRRLGILGPLENADLIGTDLTLDIHRTILPDIDRTPGPSPYLERLVATGRLGMKTGEGFRSWSKTQAEEVRGRVIRYLAKAT